MTNSEHDDQKNIIMRNLSRSRHMNKRNNNSVSIVDVFLKTLSKRLFEETTFIDAVFNQNNSKEVQKSQLNFKKKNKKKIKRRTILNFAEENYLALFNEKKHSTINKVIITENFKLKIIKDFKS